MNAHQWTLEVSDFMFPVVGRVRDVSLRAVGEIGLAIGELYVN